MTQAGPLNYPQLHSSSPAINRAYRIAIGDLAGNIHPFQDGLLTAPSPVILAGLDYDTPWTRDAAINVWNGVGLLWPEVGRSTLLAVLENVEGKVRIAGQYWDAIIWVLGAWAYYRYTGDQEFLALAYQAAQNSLERFESEEFDPGLGLFRGPAVYGDGVAAYPDRYSPGGTSSILDWVRFNPQRKAQSGYGIPMHSLSTNCVYYQACQTAGWMAQSLGLPPNPAHQQRAAALRQAIQTHFWDPERGQFRYLVDAQGGCDHQEGLGNSFALLFGLADDQQAQSIFLHQVITPAGIPCVWPTYERYHRMGGFGRHSGTAWPFISGFWGEAALLHQRPEIFEHEFQIFTGLINRHAQCAEIYHPLTGEIYGGLQESGKGSSGYEWESCARQSWTASAYLRMLLFGVLGLDLHSAELRIHPHLPAGLDQIEIQGLPYRACRLNMLVTRSPSASCRINQRPAPPQLPANATGIINIEIGVG